MGDKRIGDEMTNLDDGMMMEAKSLMEKKRRNPREEGDKDKKAGRGMMVNCYWGRPVIVTMLDC